VLAGFELTPTAPLDEVHNYGEADAELLLLTDAVIRHIG
jgi:hypothetical protein